MKWTKVTIETTTNATDMLSYYLGEYGVEGIEVRDNIPLSEEDRQAMFIDILPELPPDDGTAEISCYIEESDQGMEDGRGTYLRDLCGYIEKVLAEMSSYMDVGSGKISIGETEDRDWINRWKEFFHPFRIYDNIVIQPTWVDDMTARKDDIVVYIDPKTAFGTGSHETTQLCIEKLKDLITKDNIVSVFDVGCGSGILSIIARKLGAFKVLGVDIDELAVKASLENMELNNIPKDSYTFVRGDILNDGEFVLELEKFGKYDIVVANILADVIIPLSGIIRRFMKDGGVFITSGIINTKEAEVKAALAGNGFEIISVSHMGEWVSVVAK